MYERESVTHRRENLIMGIDWEDFYGYEEYDPADYGDAYDDDVDDWDDEE